MATNSETYFAVSNLTKSFGGLRAVDDVTFSFTEGKITGIIGANGAGKTTLLNLISGFLRADSGTVVYRGRDITTRPAHMVARVGIGRTFQDLRLFLGMTVAENVLVCLPNAVTRRWTSFIPHKAVGEPHLRTVQDILRFVGLARQADTVADDLSYGEQKMLALARVLAQDAELVLLDEPFAGLSQTTIAESIDIIRRLISQHKTIGVVDHNVEAMTRLVDYMVAVDHGRKITEGSPDEVVTNSDVRTAYLGV